MVKTKSSVPPAPQLKLLGNVPRDMPCRQLPLNKEVLLHYHKSKMDSKSNASFNELKESTITVLISLDNKVPQPIISQTGIEKKLKKLLKDYEDAKKGSETSKKAMKFKEQLNSLFDISCCKCPMTPSFAKSMMVCNCEPENKIHEKEFLFIKDQRSVRTMYISDRIDKRTSEQYEQKVVCRQTRELTSVECEPPVSDLPPMPQLTRTRQIQKDYKGL